MVDVRFSQLVKQTLAVGSADARVSQIVKQTLYTKLPPNALVSQLVKQTLVEVYYAPYTHRFSQIVKQILVEVPPIGTACTIEPITGTTSFPGLIDANWVDQVEMETEWLTDVGASKEDLAEDRTIAARRPVRHLKAALSGMTQPDATRLAKYLARLGHNKNAFPILQDRRTINLTATTGQNEIRIDTAYRRFYPGQRVGIARPDRLQIAHVAGVEVLWLQIASVLSDRIVLTANVPVQLEAGWDCYPMMDVEVVPQTRMDLGSDFVGSAIVEVLELSGCMTIPASSDEDVSAIYQYVDGYPVLDVGPNWLDGVAYEIRRELESFQSGRSSGVDTSGARAVEVFDFDFGPLTRAQFWDLLQFHDSRRGRGRGLWILHPQTLWTFVGSGLDYIDVRPYGYGPDIPEFFSHVAYVEPDGTIGIRPIDNVTIETAPTRHRLHLNAISVTPPAILDRVTAAVLCRGESDSAKEIWATEDTCASFQMKFKGLLREEVVSIG